MRVEKRLEPTALAAGVGGKLDRQLKPSDETPDASAFGSRWDASTRRVERRSEQVAIAVLG
jgi:hypothetical protein